MHIFMAEVESISNTVKLDGRLNQLVKYFLRYNIKKIAPS